MLAVDKIMAYEAGELDMGEVIGMFGELVASGLAWSLQGSYGRMAAQLIREGYISESGEVLVQYLSEEDEF